MEINKEEVGKKIKIIRMSLGETLKVFGKRLGAEASLVAHWERGSNLPNKQRLLQIAELGKMSIAELLYNEDEKVSKIKKLYGLYAENVIDAVETLELIKKRLYSHGDADSNV